MAGVTVGRGLVEVEIGGREEGRLRRAVAELKRAFAGKLNRPLTGSTTLRLRSPYPERKSDIRNVEVGVPVDGIGDSKRESCRDGSRIRCANDATDGPA